jgi:hypothetical protein
MPRMERCASREVVTPVQCAIGEACEVIVSRPKKTVDSAVLI